MDNYTMAATQTSKKITKKVKETASPKVEPQVEVKVPPSTPVESSQVTTQESQIETVRHKLERLILEREEDLRKIKDQISQLKNTVKLYDTELKSMTSKKRVKKPRDPSKPVAKNGIAKPQVISDDLAVFLFRHFKIPKGTLVSRTGALSKENGISKYITDKNLRRDGEIHPDGELIKLLGQPNDLSKDGKTKVFYHKSLMRLIGQHFPKPTSSQ